MATLNVTYLYEDLPEDYVVSAADWNTAMGTIKRVLNNHAQRIEIRLEEPTYLVVGEESGNRWQGSAPPYSCVIPKSLHSKSNVPIVRLFDADNNEVFGSHTINSINGDITIYSNSKRVVFELEVR